MRFNDRITFVVVSGGGYNPETGTHEPMKEERTTLPCNLSTLGLERTQQLFGASDKNVITARLQRPYTGKFEHIEIEQNKYKVTRRSIYRKGVLFLERVSND